MEDDIGRLYWQEGLSVREIAKRTGKPYSCIRQEMTKRGIPTRSRSEAHRLALQRGRFIPFKGEKHPRWHGGVRKQRGYIEQRCPEHPRAGKRGYLGQHILVWERCHGKLLPKGWVVHHLNGIKDDNRPENLMALPRNSHSSTLLLQAIRKKIRELEAELRALKSQRRLL